MRLTRRPPNHPATHPTPLTGPASRTQPLHRVSLLKLCQLPATAPPIPLPLLSTLYPFFDFFLPFSLPPSNPPQPTHRPLLPEPHRLLKGYIEVFPAALSCLFSGRYKASICPPRFHRYKTSFALLPPIPRYLVLLLLLHPCATHPYQSL